MNSARRSCSRRARARISRYTAMPGPISNPMMMTSGQCVAAIQTMVSRVGAYVRSRMANQTLNAISGIATVSSAPLDSMGSTRVYYSSASRRGRAVRSAVAIIKSSH